MDIAAVIGTIFGIATTLGIGVVQLNYGLSVLFDIPDSMAAKAALIALSVIIATISVTAGVDKGIRVLSELNVALALGLILFVLFMGDTSFLLNALVLNVGDYVNRFMGMTLNSFAFDRPVEWMNSWTLFFWAWWVARSPFVGLFLARISRGRTIRQFVLGTLIIPFTFTLLWLSVFGNSALHEIIHGDAAFAQRRWRTRSAVSTACWRSIRRSPLAPPWRPLPACCSTSPRRIPARWCWGTSPRS